MSIIYTNQSLKIGKKAIYQVEEVLRDNRISGKILYVSDSVVDGLYGHIVKPQIEAVGKIKEEIVDYNTISYAMNVAERVIATDIKCIVALGGGKTIYEEERLFEHTLELLSAIKKRGGRYVFITNNSSKSVTDYVKKVKRLGIVADEENFFTSAQATILQLLAKHKGEKVYCQGTHSFVSELQAAGIDVVEEVDKSAFVVLVGFDTELTSQKLRNTCEMLQGEVTFYATNPDLACPVSFGFIPDCGSICKMIENATGRTPLYIGKPEPTMIDIVRQKYGYEKEDVVVVGDRLYTDIAAGLNAKVDAVCVLTGEAKKKDIIDGSIKPTFTFDSVSDIYYLLQNEIGC